MRVFLAFGHSPWTRTMARISVCVVGCLRIGLRIDSEAQARVFTGESLAPRVQCQWNLRVPVAHWHCIGKGPGQGKAASQYLLHWQGLPVHPSLHPGPGLTVTGSPPALPFAPPSSESEHGSNSS